MAAATSSFEFILLVFVASVLVTAISFAVMYWQRQRRRDAFEEEKWRANIEMNNQDSSRHRRQPGASQDLGNL